ncbi:tetratricopeptide repeat protein [Aureibacter tunicatorum]|uniref:Tetratricopeptide (TPR) repeat protein n=1 Tax=Aureibacter tunicatorum TaxID=866807 RepID=A0AAE3XMJ6_9BACT|nr:tetratricopeptide repeat protein [Aureibacter tunicatorum]MDR6238679.1 tetratricopeptide (TPR) repeat protein [Aureibacter tunicatorum]BDD05390.1 hypothetical protein AUTU_28730 [Aureibacter tunicatorum]
MENKVVSELLEKGVSWAYWKGYDWFASQLIPAVELLDEKISSQRLLLSQCWSMIGEIHLLNLAPEEAKRAYFKAVKLDPKSSEAIADMAHAQYQLGEYSEALKNISLAIDLDSDNESYWNDKQMITDAVNYDERPLFDKEDQAWQWNEMLAKGDFEQILSAFENIEEEELELFHWLIAARVYGAKNDLEKYLEAWQCVAEQNEVFDLDYVDWFYMPMKAFESTEMWTLLKNLNPRIDDAVFIEFESLQDNYGEELTELEMRNLICDYFIALYSMDKKSMKKIADKYPLWEEVDL